MVDTPHYHSFPLSDSQDGVGYGDGKKVVEGLLYIPRLRYVQMDEKVSDLRMSGRTPDGERWPKPVADCLRRLASVIRKGQLVDNEHEERIAVENGLSKLHEAQTAFEAHGLPEPKLLTRLQIDLTRVRNELDPGQSPDRTP